MMIFSLLILAAILSGGAGLATFELFIHRLATRHPEEWAGSGYPVGWIQMPPMGNFFRGQVSRWRFWGKLIINTPKWVQLDPTARFILRIYRISILIYAAALLGVFGFIAVALLLS